MVNASSYGFVDNPGLCPHSKVKSCMKWDPLLTNDRTMVKMMTGKGGL